MKSFHRVVRVLEFLAESGDGASLTQIAQMTGIPITSVHRMLSALQSHDLVVRNPRDRTYELGYGLVKLAQPVLSRLSGYWNALPYLDLLRDRWQECCYLGSLVDDQVVCLQIAEVSNPHRMRFFVHPGRIMPFNCSAGGKVILAHQDAKKIEEIVAKTEFRAFTPRTIIDKEELRQHLSVIRDRGYGLCEEELEIGVSAVAVPIRNVSGKVKSCITVVAPSARLQMHLGDGLADMLKSTGESISSCFIERS